MPRVIKAYVRYVDALNRAVGNVVLYMIFVMMAVLLFGSISRYFFNASFLWVIEMSQFLMAAYYLLGGGFSLQMESHVRMDVFYERWAPRTRACGVWYLSVVWCQRQPAARITLSTSSPREIQRFRSNWAVGAQDGPT